MGPPLPLWLLEQGRRNGRLKRWVIAIQDASLLLRTGLAERPVNEKKSVVCVFVDVFGRASWYDSGDGVCI